MKYFSRTVIAILLVLTLGIQIPVRAYAQGQAASGPDYISEVKIAMGSGAEDALSGYTILKDEKGNAIDLNTGAGGGWGSQGDRKVILGYKTTKEQSKAITDLAVMNMKGGYDVQEYEALIRQRMDSQVIPFIRKFQTTINEYRENITSDDDVNRARAEYTRAALNKFTDDDCGGAGLGDLLLNETKFEMGDAAYDALSDAEKNKHCDIVTLFMQADGQIMLMIYDLLTRAADTNEDSWMERFSGITYDELLDSYDMSPADAKIQAAKDFEDDARIVLQNWDQFREMLTGADEAAAKLEKMNVTDYNPAGLGKNPDTQALINAITDMLNARAEQTEAVELAAAVVVADYLENIPYGDGTMYDFFTKSSTDLEKDPGQLYPLVASLSEGQRAGMEFISLREMVMISNRDTEYSAEEFAGISTVSVFEGVDRGIYEKGGVALTWDARRTEALEAEKNAADKGIFEILSAKTLVMWCLTGVASLGFIASASVAGTRGVQLLIQNHKLKSITDGMSNSQMKMNELLVLDDVDGGELTGSESAFFKDAFDKNATTQTIKNLAASGKTAAWMSAGFAAAMVILAGVSVYLTWEDMKDFYKVDFSPIPHYMVDETAITYYVNNVKMVKENHAAYYKAVTCANRTDQKNIEILGDCADLNGDVGQQWLALYACWDNKACQPILADSLKVVVDSTEIPAGYETGIHMFGSETAFNLNNKLYDWNQSAKSVFVYFKIDENAPVKEAGTSGSAFSGGWIALAAVLGIGLGAVITAVSMTAVRKKKGVPYGNRRL